MTRMLIFAAALTMAVAGCATRESGIRDPERFRTVAERTTLVSSRAHTDVAGCFRDTAALLPMTTFVEVSDTRTTYRLRGYGFTFEEIDFDAAPGGTEVTVMLAPGVNPRWRRDFARDRLEPLRACAAGA